MQSDKRGSRVLLDNVIPLRQQRLLGWKLRPVEAPRRIRNQLFVALVVTIQWREKCLRVRRMDGNGNTQSSAFLPNRIEPRIINGNQLSRPVAHSQAQIL